LSEYIYIVQAERERDKCKIGITGNLEERLRTYNNITGKSKANGYSYLFSCEVHDMAKVEADIKAEFSRLREHKNREIYFYNPDLFEDYVAFIKKHSLFVKEIFIKPSEIREEVKVVKKITPSPEERGLNTKDIMQKAQRTKNDEFYTRYEDIETEIAMYPLETWQDKVVYCNCDDAVGDSEKTTSPFALYFLRNFKKLELKKLICTHYSGRVDLFNAGTKAYIFTKEGFTENLFEGKREMPKGYDGSFDHPISLQILNDEADIVCTNPPFSISRDYWRLLMESSKQFLIISNIAIVLTASYIPYFKNKKAWAGYNEVDWYLNPKRELTRAAGYWYTNLSVTDRPKYKQFKFILLKDIPDKYKYFDDEGVLVVKNCYIPSNYSGVFAVSARPILNGLLEKGYEIVRDREYYPYVNGEKQFAVVLVQKIGSEK